MICVLDSSENTVLCHHQWQYLCVKFLPYLPVLLEHTCTGTSCHDLDSVTDTPISSHSGQTAVRCEWLLYVRWGACDGEKIG